MCGIIGYVGTRDVVPVLIGGLKKLEYRGYDSAGIAVVNSNGVEVVRAEGKLSNLEGKLAGRNLPGTFGMGHTRWATHGKPNENNAHPHRDCTGQIVVIHNGIIENFLSLKQRLQKAGHEFRTETDTEVVAHLIEENMKNGTKFIEAVKKTLKELDGHYALVMIDGNEPGTIVAAKQGPPLVIGLGENENIIASDVAPLLAYTRNINYLEDGEYAIVDQKSVRVFTKDDKPVDRAPKRITWDAVMAEKEGYRHYMLKEIHEQARAVRDTFTGRMFEESGEVFFNELSFTPEEWAKIKRVHVVACGTSWHAGLVGKFLLEEAARIPIEVDYGSEYRYRNPIVDENTLVIGV
ncbi:MAG: glutamine--fructose-6-phosphate transaminase (isomerizing), partial [Thermoanaerobaculia bacterium]